MFMDALHRLFGFKYKPQSILRGKRFFFSKNIETMTVNAVVCNKSRILQDTARKSTDLQLYSVFTPYFSLNLY